MQKGRHRLTNGDSIYLQIKHFKLLEYIFLLIVTCGLFIFAGRPKWLYYYEDVTDETNPLKRIKQRRNELALEWKQLDIKEEAETKRLSGIRKDIKDSPDATLNYSNDFSVDLSKYKDVSTTIPMPKDTWKQVFATVGTSTANKVKGSKKPINNNLPPSGERSLLAKPEDIKKLGFTLDDIAEKRGATSIMPIEEPKNKQGDTEVTSEMLNKKNNIKNETKYSAKERRAMIDRGETVPSDWDITKTSG